MPRVADIRLRLRIVMVTAAAVGAGVICGGLIMNSKHLAERGSWLTYALATAWPLIGVGILWRWVRPASSYGAVLVAAGSLSYLYGLLGADDPIVYCCGVLAEAVVVLALVYLVLSFPAGRLRRVELVLAIGVATVLLLGRSVLVLVDDDVVPLSPLAACRPACPTDLFQLGQIVLPRSLGRDLHGYWQFSVGAIASAAIVSRALFAGTARLRVIGPPCAGAVLWTACLAGCGIALLAGLPAATVAWTVAATGLLLPYGFLASLVAGRAIAIRALTRIVTEMNAGASMLQLQGAMRRIFGDPELRLAFRLEAAEGFVDIEGSPVGPGNAARDQRWTELSGGETPAAAIIHDSMLAEDPDFLRAAAGTARLVVASSRLSAELLRSFEELRWAQRRTVQAEETARRELERNLHDGAQQQLVVARIALGRVREQARERAMKDRIGEVDRLLESVQDELRDIAHGLAPLVLRQRGLVAALRLFSRRVPQTVAVHDHGIERYDPGIEAAVYYCCVGAIENVLGASRAGVARQRVMVDMRLWEDQSRLHFEVQDPGLGLDVGSVTNANEFASMADHVGAMGGALDLTLSPLGGAILSGWVPTRPPR